MPNESSQVSLNQVQVGADDVILPNFPAFFEGRTVWVTAVLERTVIIEPAPGEPKMVINQRHCLVDPDVIRFRPSVNRNAARRGREMARRNRTRQESAA
jgi:hypothetical protein